MPGPMGRIRARFPECLAFHEFPGDDPVQVHPAPGMRRPFF